ncbi:hypothetical protein H632_c1398p0, partial [Helicosporidium sp. ATCC 50920]
MGVQAPLHRTPRVTLPFSHRAARVPPPGEGPCEEADACLLSSPFASLDLQCHPFPSSGSLSSLASSPHVPSASGSGSAPLAPRWGDAPSSPALEAAEWFDRQHCQSLSPIRVRDDPRRAAGRFLFCPRPSERRALD